MKKRILLLAGIASFLLTSFTQLPAKLVLDHLPASIPLRLQNVTGTLWQGSASHVTWQQLSLRNVQWDLQWGALLGGQLALTWQAQPTAGGSAKGTCSISLSRQIACTDLEIAALPAQAATPYLQRYHIPALRGTFQAQLATLAWQAGTTPHATGQLEWRDAGSSLAPQTFGNYRIMLTTDDGGTQQATFSSAPDAAFAASGTASLQTTGDYQINLDLTPDASVPPPITQGLGMMLGTPQADGRFHLEKQGKLTRP